MARRRASSVELDYVYFERYALEKQLQFLEKLLRDVDAEIARLRKRRDFIKRQIRSIRTRLKQIKKMLGED